ncbi:MAG: twin-arginine translocase TatA/TatE family subunit [Kiritimatiellaceae bacterium]|nr:twin-arginine translocase TatA/TatE family subunit [Kiritimatiellaceae bacterium]
MNIGTPEIILIVFVIILLFGGKKLPELARSLGKSLNEFKRGQNETTTDVKTDKSGETDSSTKK